MDRSGTIKFLRDTLSRPGIWLFGTNLQYELEAVHSLGIDISNAKLVDIQIAEALIDEDRDEYDLDSLCLKYLEYKKEERLLKTAADAYGINPKHELWKLHSKYVGAYAEVDSRAPIEIFRKQLKVLQSEDLMKIFEIESKLLPILWNMRLQGIPVNLEAAEKLSKSLAQDEGNFRSKMFLKYGCHIDEWSGPMISRVCDDRGIKYPRTKKGNPNFDDDFLKKETDPLFADIADLREMNRLRSTFIDEWIFKNQIKGRIHPQWKQLKRDDGGTRTGRMAASNPNPQQIPAEKRRDGTINEIGLAIRALFHNPDGLWAKLDYSQQEPRILVHFAHVCKFRGADIARQAYVDDPKMDFYQMLVKLANINRRMAKDMFLGRCYGMGKKKMALKMGRSIDECEQILRDFDAKVPFVKEIADSCNNKARIRGWIRTLCGRRRHFVFWEPADTYDRKQRGEYVIPLRRAEAEKHWPNSQLVRSDTHKALNSLIQGSAADMTKMALISIHDELGIIPFMAVHDEVDCPVPDEAQAKEVQTVMQTCVNMTVPIVCDLELGEHWK